MDTNVTEKRDRLLQLLHDIESGRNPQDPALFSPAIFQQIEQLAPEGVICAISAPFPETIRRASGELIVAILLDTTFYDRYGLLLTLESMSLSAFMDPLIEAMQEQGLADELKALGGIAATQVRLFDCETRACLLRRSLSVRTLLHHLEAYRD